MTTPIWTKRTIQMVSPSTAAAATAVIGTSESEFLDTTDANYATIVVNMSSEKNTDNLLNPVLSLQESDTTDASNFATVIADVVPNIVAAAQHVYGIDMKVRKKFLMMRITPLATTDGNIQVSVTGTLERMKQTPTNTTDMVNVGAVTLVP